MPNKPLTIDVSANCVPNGSLNNWRQLDNTSVFIANIQTPDLTENANVGHLVSGIPSAFARVDLFKTAIDYMASATPEAAKSHRNLTGYYETLVNEWRGLIACFALDYAHISVRRIDLNYSDGKDILSTANVYEPKGAFGNMLLKRAPLWCERSENQNDRPSPYINVIKYRNKVVGATAPESLIFTSTGYRAEPADDRPWVDAKTGKFIDPLKSSMTADQIATLHAYVDHLIHTVDNAQAYFVNLPNGLKVNYTCHIYTSTSPRDAHE